MRCLLLLSLIPQVTALCSLSDSWARVNAEARRGEAVWAGPTPAKQLDPWDVITLVLGALQRNNFPHPHAGSACLLRFSTDDCRLAGAPASRPAPDQLTNFLSVTQYHLLLDEAATFDFPSDCLQLDEEHAFQDMALFSSHDQAAVDAKLGWSLRREPEADGRRACWLVSDLTWHDFRPRFRPGIGQEEWPRICG
jgi:hypothetical protein